ncbi:hypothetical protein [Actinomyces radicidentis]|uniref:hypothetical protein n=1 Tax=Actinomyces radicidentis TaxID=111015 RepID=UPI0028E7F638|nr:hypothetical protein [Actinomyces radicidentis]
MTTPYAVDPITLADVQPGDALLIGAHLITVARVVETERPSSRGIAGPPLIKKCIRLYDVDGDVIAEAPLDEIAHRLTSKTDVLVPAGLLIDLEAAFQGSPEDVRVRDELIVDAANAIVAHLHPDKEPTR